MLRKKIKKPDGIAVSNRLHPSNFYLHASSDRSIHHPSTTMGLAPRKAPTVAAVCSMDVGTQNPRNFLTKGGVRAFEHQIDQMNKAVVLVSEGAFFIV